MTAHWLRHHHVPALLLFSYEALHGLGLSPFQDHLTIQIAARPLRLESLCLEWGGGGAFSEFPPYQRQVWWTPRGRGAFLLSSLVVVPNCLNPLTRGLLSTCLPWF